MKLLRNKEVARALAWQAILAAAAAAVAFSWERRFGIFTLALGGLFCLGYWLGAAWRYRRIAELSAQIDRILHGADAPLSLGQCGEGELSILQSEIYKMTVRLREQRQQLQKDKTYLADSIADISHQIRTPLTTVNLLAQLQSEPGLPDRRRTQLTHELLNALSRIDWLVTALLKMSRLDAGTVSLKREDAPLETLLQTAVGPLLAPIEVREQRLIIDAQGGFTGDVAWTAEAIGNIVKNCMEHTPAGGEITLTARENALYSELVVTDTGGGIDEADLPHIFERFYKGKHAGEQSFGIGLALARTIITAQNGTVKAENRRPAGAMFTVRFYKGTV